MVNTLYLPELREMLAEHDDAGLEEFCTALHPARTADFMEGLSPAESWEVLSHADVASRTEIFSYFPREKQVEMLETLDREEMGQLIGELPPDERVDMLEQLDEKVVNELMPLVPSEERSEILLLQAYPENSAGSVMTTKVVSLSENITKQQALEEVREWGDQSETVNYLFLVDDAKHLRGVVSFRTLVFARNEQRLSELMERDVISVRATEDREEAARLLGRYDLLAIPVVDDQNHLVGLITHDDVLDVLREEATEDAHMAGAVQPLEESYLETALLTLTGKRAMWLTILFFSGLLTTTAMSHYEEFIATLPWLICFIPLVISCGGNSGNQSATLIITALTTGDVTMKDWFRVIRRELIMGLLLGGLLAFFGLFAVIGVGFMLPETWHILATTIVPVTLILVVTCGTLTGSMLPLMFRKFKLDPALMSNPFVAVIMDILGIVIYMSVAQIAFKLLTKTAT